MYVMRCVHVVVCVSASGVCGAVCIGMWCAMCYVVVYVSASGV